VTKAVENINTTIADSLTGWDAVDQIGIDQRLIELDGTATRRTWGRTRSSACRWPWRSRRPISASSRCIAIWGRRREPAAGPDDEHHQWRSARR